MPAIGCDCKNVQKSMLPRCKCLTVAQVLQRLKRTDIPSAVKWFKFIVVARPNISKKSLKQMLFCIMSRADPSQHKMLWIEFTSFVPHESLGYCKFSPQLCADLLAQKLATEQQLLCKTDNMRFEDLQCDFCHIALDIRASHIEMEYMLYGVEMPKIPPRRGATYCNCHNLPGNCEDCGKLNSCDSLPNCPGDCKNIRNDCSSHFNWRYCDCEQCRKGVLSSKHPLIIYFCECILKIKFHQGGCTFLMHTLLHSMSQVWRHNSKVPREITAALEVSFLLHMRYYTNCFDTYIIAHTHFNVPYYKIFFTIQEIATEQYSTLALKHYSKDEIARFISTQDQITATDKKNPIYSNHGFYRGWHTKFWRRHGDCDSDCSECDRELDLDDNSDDGSEESVDTVESESYWSDDSDGSDGSEGSDCQSCCESSESSESNKSSSESNKSSSESSETDESSSETDESSESSEIDIDDLRIYYCGPACDYCEKMEFHNFMRAARKQLKLLQDLSCTECTQTRHSKGGQVESSC